MGVPVLTMELAVGRASRKSADPRLQDARKAQVRSGTSTAGSACSAATCLMMYYTTVSGWMVSYFGKFLTGTFHSGMSTEDASRACSARCCPTPAKWRILAEVVVVAGFVVCSLRPAKGS